MLRIELGCRMQKYISDDDVEEIIDAHIIPAFKRGDYAGGVQAGVMELMRLDRRFVLKRMAKGKFRQPPRSSSRLPATGTNSAWPNFSRPKFLITAWVSGATMKSANALPPAVLMRGPFAGFTSITE